MHTLDATQLYRLALEGAPAGDGLHAVGNEGIAFGDIAEAIGHHLNLSVVSIPPEGVASHFDFLGAFVSLDTLTSSALTEELLGWRPLHTGLIDDPDQGHHFDNQSA